MSVRSARPRISSHPHALTWRRRQHHTTITHTGLPKSAAPNSIMPVKCSFCGKRYEGAGAYETHLRSAHANLDMVLASTIRNPPAEVLTNRGTDLSQATELIEHSDSDYKSDPAGDTAGSERDAPDYTLGRQLEPKYSRTTRTLSLRNRRIIRAPGKPLERLKSIRKNAGICARTHGLRFLLHKVSNLHLGSWRAKSQRRGLTITFRMVSETQHPSAIALYIRWRIFSDTWIRIARICNGCRDMWSTVREHYHSSIGTTKTA